MLALVLVCALVALFWATYDQQGNTILLWAEDFTDRSVDLGIWRGELAAPWFVALNPLFIFVFTPLIVRLWAWQGARGREPFPIAKMAFGCICVALANLLMAAAASLSAGKASPFWLVGYFVLITVGELYLAPVGLALVSRIAPARVLSMMMGVWLATTFPADILGGWLGGFFSTMAKPHFFLMMASHRGACRRGDVGAQRRPANDADAGVTGTPRQRHAVRNSPQRYISIIPYIYYYEYLHNSQYITSDISYIYFISKNSPLADL